jgi:hypothetical protein
MVYSPFWYTTYGQKKVVDQAASNGILGVGAKEEKSHMKDVYSGYFVYDVMKITLNGNAITFPNGVVYKK